MQGQVMITKLAGSGPRMVGLALVGLVAGCLPPPPPPPPPAPPPPPPFVFPHREVWSAEAGLTLEGDSASARVPRPFTRLEVLAADSLELRVRCPACGKDVAGRVGMDEVVFDAGSPEAAAGRGLADFALAVREAARRHDVEALRPVMAPGFTFSFVGLQGVDRALTTWEMEGFETLDRVPDLLDRGLATRDSALWAGPPEHLEELDYRGLRAGFRRTSAGRWEWVFLVRSDVPVE